MTDRVANLRIAEAKVFFRGALVEIGVELGGSCAIEKQIAVPGLTDSIVLRAGEETPSLSRAEARVEVNDVVRIPLQINAFAKVFLERGYQRIGRQKSFEVELSVGS